MILERRQLHRLGRETMRPWARRARCSIWPQRAINPRATELFLPYLSGERTPHNDPKAQGVLFGLTHESAASAIAQAVLEGVAFAFRDGMDALLASGASIDSIAVIGGGARSRILGQNPQFGAAPAVDLPRQRLPSGPAYGAARLARMGQRASEHRSRSASRRRFCTSSNPTSVFADLYDGHVAPLSRASINT